MTQLGGVQGGAWAARPNISRSMGNVLVWIAWNECTRVRPVLNDRTPLGYPMSATRAEQDLSDILSERYQPTVVPCADRLEVYGYRAFRFEACD